MCSFVMRALLPIPIKNRNIPQKGLVEQRQTNLEVQNKVLRRVLQPVTFEQNSSTESGYYNHLCADGDFRRCQPVVAAWLADCPQYSNLHQRCQHPGCRCQTLVTPCSPRIQHVSTYSIHRERPPKARPSPYNADQHT